MELKFKAIASKSDVESKLQQGEIPRHVAIVMDGNRTWAKLNNRPAKFGHWKGASTVNEIVEVAVEVGIESLTLYAFSTENWKRSSTEIDALMSIFEINLYKMRKKMIQNGVKFETIGDLNRFPDSVRKAIDATKKATSQGSKLNLILALNYGARDELRRSMIKVYREMEQTKTPIEQLSEASIAKHLDTAPYGDPDLMIRTGGAMRLSNFLLWQASYAEFYSTPVLWPDFKRQHFVAAILEYQNRQRRLGE